MATRGAVRAPRPKFPNQLSFSFTFLLPYTEGRLVSGVQGRGRKGNTLTVRSVQKPKFVRRVLEPSDERVALCDLEAEAEAAEGEGEAHEREGAADGEEDVAD